jgi:heptosyltransferase-2
VQHILVIRFGSLGDLCLLAWSLARLRAGGDGRQHVTLATKAAFADLMAAVPGIDAVVSLDGASVPAVADLAHRLRRRRFDVIVDAHNILRGHLLLALMRRRPDLRLAKDTAARLALLVAGHRPARLTRTMRDRFDELLAPLRPAGIYAATPPVAPLGALAAGDGATDPPSDPPLGLAPGARWDTKRWPEERFAALVTAWRSRTRAPLRIFIGPDELAWFKGSALARSIERTSASTLIAGRPLRDVAAQLGGCAALVTNDSGLMHLAEATGTPVFALFGPTVREFGYFPSLPDSRVFETDLDCRPCSRNGKRPCHRGDLACLTRIPAATILDALANSRSWPPPRKDADDA